MSDLPRILIVDDSRMVRATLIKHLSGSFDAREEVDGEAGWQALLDDPTIAVLISDLSMPKLDGYGLLDRMRASEIERIRAMPVIMISGDEDEEARARAKRSGATDFIQKGIGTAELLARLDTLVRLARTSHLLQERGEHSAIDPDTGLPTWAMLARQCALSLSYARRHGLEVSVLVMGVDRHAEHVAAHGQAFGTELLRQFARLLEASTRKEDVLGASAAAQLAIVSLGASVPASSAFADRIREIVAGANISAQGQVLRVTVSLGIANSGADDAKSAEALLALATERMTQAMQAGGNRVVAPAAAPKPLPVAAGREIEHALNRLAAGDVASVRARLAPLARRLMPLLRLLEDEYRLGLPLAELERKLEARPGRREDD